MDRIFPKYSLYNVFKNQPNKNNIKQIFKIYIKNDLILLSV